ncbi:DUF4410 domain-containing protein [Thermodesulfobacteriota bacterium]
MIRKYAAYFIFLIAVISLASGCASSGRQAKGESPQVVSFKDYPDHELNLRGYIQGMSKAGHNILLWQDPSVDLSQYDSVEIMAFGSRFLPVQNKFSYDPFIKNFDLALNRSLKLKAGQGPNALRIEGEVVECNPGSRAARYWVGYGAGKAGAGVICEVYLPDQTRPCIKIYSRDRASSGMWGGDSIAMLNSMFDRVATRVATALEARIGR